MSKVGIKIQQESMEMEISRENKYFTFVGD